MTLENPSPKPDLRHPLGIEDFLLFRMHKVVALAGSLVTRICEGRFGITRREWTVLAVIARARKISWRDAGKRCEIDDARLSRAVTSLAKKGLVEKAYLPDRQLLLSLTEQGDMLYAEILPLAREIHHELIEVLDRPQVDMLDATLATLHARAESLAQTVPLPKARRSRGAKTRTDA